MNDRNIPYKEEDFAAIRIQNYIRGFNSRKKTNIYGKSEGKEIEIYIPWAVKKINEDKISVSDMVGNYKYTVCESDFFNITIDLMKFSCQSVRKLKIPEIVTAPFRRSDEINSNLYTEEEIDKAVGDFLLILDDMIVKAQGQKCTLLLNTILEKYNDIHPDHPLKLTTQLKKYLANPIYKPLFEDQWVIVGEHKDIELCFYYDPAYLPLFDKSNTPRTVDAGNNISNQDFQKGKLLVHIQKTFSMPVEKYTPTFFSKAGNEKFHFTEQQLEILKIARERSENFIKKHPLPVTASQERMLGLLTIAVEQILTVTHAKKYEGLHEKADRPILSIRHILHYVKSIICNQEEMKWFDDMFLNHQKDIQEVLCVQAYNSDYRSYGSGYGVGGLSDEERYDVVFDLFGSFKNGHSLTKDDFSNPLLVETVKKLEKFNILSWENLYDNHCSLSGRSHFILQKIIKEDGNTEYLPLFEARRIGLMTIDEFRRGDSRISLNF